jgi:hypothetical protein
MDAPSHPPAFRVLTLGLVLLIALGLDYGVRQVYLKITHRPLVFHSPHRIPHPVYHHGIQSNQVSTDAIGKYSAPFFSNSLGMKDAQVREVPLEGKQPRVLLLGDSFTEGIGTPWEKTFAGILAAQMEASGVELLNGGTVSYSPHLMRLRMEELLARGLKVNRVVVFIDISDVLNELQYAEQGDGTVHYEEYAPFEDQAKSIRQINERCGWLESHVEKNFVIVGAIVRNLRLLWRSRESKVGIHDYDEIPRWAWNWPDYRGPYEKYIDEGLRRGRDNMDRLALRLRQENIPLTVVVYPWPQQIRSGTRGGRGEVFWRKWCEQRGVDFVSLYPDFLTTEKPADVIRQYYWASDCHWNEAGQRLVAKSLWSNHRSAMLPAVGKAPVSRSPGK